MVVRQVIVSHISSQQPVTALIMGSHADWEEMVGNHFLDYNNILADMPGHGKSSLRPEMSYIV